MSIKVIPCWDIFCLVKLFGVMIMDESRGREWRRIQARKHKRGNIKAMKAIFPTVMPLSRMWDNGMIHPFTRQGNSWMGEMRKDFKANKVMPQDPMEDEV